MSDKGRNVGIPLKGIESLPLQIPFEILEVQGILGQTAVLLWINLLAFSQKQKPITIKEVQKFMGVDKRSIEKALALLAEHGWINDEGMVIQLNVPESLESLTSLDSIDEDTPSQNSFEWVCSFWTNRVSSATSDDTEKLLFWMQAKGVSHEVIAVAIEEMCASVAKPSFPYLEGILRNWYNEGVRTYADLIDKPYLTKVLPGRAEEALHPEAVRKWKELFPDAFE